MFPIRPYFSNILKGVGSVRFVSSVKLVDVAVDKDGVATVTMQRPPVNSLNLELLQSLSGALDEVANNKCRAMILTSASPKVFTAGMDFTEIYKPDRKRLETYISCFQDVWYKIYGSDFISAAAINGHAPAAGCIYAMSCEYRAMVCGNYTIGLNETLFGGYPPKWIISTMSNIISKRETEYAVTTGRMFSVDEALKVGLIDTVATDKADAIEKCKQFIKKFDKVPSSARAKAKKNSREDLLQWTQKNRQAIVDEICDMYEDPNVTAILETYIQKVQKKTAVK